MCKIRRKLKATTSSKHGKPVASELLKRTFSAAQPDQAYVGDITYMPTWEGWLYLATFIAPYSREVVSCSIDSHMPASLAHSDRGASMPPMASSGC